MATAWTPTSWHAIPPSSSPTGPTRPTSTGRSSRSPAIPPLVFAGEARSLQAALAQVAAGNAFLLQAGDCAESFEDFSANNIREKLRVILQMAVVLTYSMGVPVVKVGRIAGQFAKPRSSLTERIGDDEIPVVPRPHRQRPGADRSGQDPRPRPARAGVPPVGVDAEPGPGVHQGRLRRPRPGARLDPGVRRVEPRGPALRAGRERDRAGAALHARLRDGHRVERRPARGRRLHQPRGVDARLRGGAHPAGLDDRRLVRLLGAHALDRRAHPRARRRARRVPARRRQPDRLQGRSDDHRRPTCCSCARPSTRRASPGG